jgi:hypothetical protein
VYFSSNPSDETFKTLLWVRGVQWCGVEWCGVVLCGV